MPHASDPAMSVAPLPLIGIPADQRDLDELTFDAVGRKYVTAVASAARAQPVVVPALGAGLDLADLLGRLDGLLFTGSPSNVEPRRYGGPPSRPEALHDSARDATTLRLMPAAIEAGLPVFAICRGVQELNVVHGGTLHQHLHEVEGRIDHRGDASKPVAERYAPAHDVAITAGGLIERLTGRREAKVNSLHGQGIDRVGDDLIVEARADDGTIEAVRVGSARGFALGVQWHPEWRPAENRFYFALFDAFGAAARAWRRRQR